MIDSRGFSLPEEAIRFQQFMTSRVRVCMLKDEKRRGGERVLYDTLIGGASYHDMLVALGAAFIIAGAVGIYMMLATRQVAKKLHERFNAQNEILNSHTEILNSHTEIMGAMNDSLREIASSQKDTTEILKRIEDKL